MRDPAATDGVLSKEVVSRRRGGHVQRECWRSDRMANLGKQLEASNDFEKLHSAMPRCT